MQIEKQVADFLSSLETRGFSERTVVTYSWCVRKFLAFLEKYYPRISTLDKVTKNVVLDYQEYLRNQRTRKGEPLANKTQSLKLRAVRSFFCFLAREDFILRDPTSALIFPKEEQRLTRSILSEKEVFRLLDELKPRDPLTIRNRAIIELFYACGIRTSELCSLRIEDVDLKDQTVTIVRGKGNKSRIVPIGQYACYYIDLYLNKARKHMLKGRPKDPGVLFLSQRGNPFDRNTINKCVIKSIASRKLVDKAFSCYTFRHSVATHLLRNKVDIMYIAQLLGHASLRTTQKYLRVEISDLKKMHSLCHPREKNAVCSSEVE